ncbi:MAG: Gfo/Idh/MocA family oxidoreductase [Rickettsiales bacterium]|jgi:predicted dehydrogenase|nr:Gfo/Idh/MocA family oxidoreductase [Rickettsiales bacterium]
MQKIRLALLGLGRVSRAHLDAIGGNPGFKLVATCDPAVPGADFVDLGEMLDKAAPDVVSVCTPSGLHFKHAMQCMAFGASVIVEKPLAMGSRDAKRLYRLAKKKGVRIFPLYQNRLNPTVAEAMAALPKLGKIVAVNARMFWHRDEEYYCGWRKKCGGVLENQASHYIDLIHWFAGAGVRAAASGTKAGAGALPVKVVAVQDKGRTAMAVVKFKNGALASLSATTRAHADAEGAIEIVGEKGIVEIGGPALNKITKWTVGPRPDKDYDAPSVYGGSHVEFYGRVARAMLDGQEFFMPKNDAIGSIELQEKILKSARR